MTDDCWTDTGYTEIPERAPEPWHYGRTPALINNEGLVKELLHMRSTEVYLVEEFTREVWLDFCDDWSPSTRAKTMKFIEEAWARGNTVYCRHKPGGRFQYLEVARDVMEAIDDADYMLMFLESDAAWDQMQEDYQVHTIQTFVR